jgi:hypothetical protein
MRNYLFISFLVLSSCFLHNPIMAQSENVNYSSDKSFNIFWADFREAVIKNDTTKLTNLTHFPLKVRGERDEDSVIYLRINNFIFYYKKFLLNSSFLVKGIYITNFEYIRNTEMPEKATLFQETKTWKRVGDLEFEKINNKWGLALLYCPR